MGNLFLRSASRKACSDVELLLHFWSILTEGAGHGFLFTATSLRSVAATEEKCEVGDKDIHPSEKNMQPPSTWMIFGIHCGSVSGMQSSNVALDPMPRRKRKQCETGGRCLLPHGCGLCHHQSPKIIRVIACPLQYFIQCLHQHTTLEEIFALGPKS